MKETPLTKKADRLFQETVRMMWRNTCCWCRRYTEAGAGHHLYGRSRQDTRWHLVLAPYLCTECHNKVHTKGQKRLLAYLEKHWNAVFECFVASVREQHIPRAEFKGYVEGQIESLLVTQENLKERDKCRG